MQLFERAFQGVRNVCFSENLACFVFFKHPFLDSPFCRWIPDFPSEVICQFETLHLVFLDFILQVRWNCDCFIENNVRVILGYDISYVLFWGNVTSLIFHFLLVKFNLLICSRKYKEHCRYHRWDMNNYISLRIAAAHSFYCCENKGWNVSFNFVSSDRAFTQVQLNNSFQI